MQTSAVNFRLHEISDENGRKIDTFAVAQKNVTRVTLLLACDWLDQSRDKAKAANQYVTCCNKTKHSACCWESGT